MDEAGNSGDDPLSPRNAYTRQHSGHRQDRRQSDVERVLPSQPQHQQSTRTLTVPAQLAAAFPSWSREAADTLFGLLERGDNAQAAAISEAFSGVSFPAGLSTANRPVLSPHGGQHQSSHPLQQASALQHLQHHHLQQVHGLQRRNGDHTTSNETFVPAGTDTHSLLAQYQLQAQHLAAAPRYAMPAGKVESSLSLMASTARL